MGLWPFGRKATEDKNVDQLLAEANAASPPSVSFSAEDPAPTPVAQPGGGGFRMPVEDIFMITGRGVVVTGRIESGVATVGQQVQIVRDGGVIATTKVNGIEKFRAVMESATVGENVGLLLDGLNREQLHQGDLIQG
jgi:translation elongation factor EF-Tu-like GTPase